ncbi:hypothetical protein C8A05DRAFT_35017 [Staphylotrichum tortipilum]|uniref:Uncharacterized protein n=1 Tax=Staphylotrichum tortipilum TaxID=2831512 RepID=A0AAN6MI34_9PEZI|nr:hypothetical protein C8A05DRAFT_35017 [Staphylotrichum longicolle]
MSGRMSSKLEQLPWLVLNRICEYLDEDSDDAVYLASQIHTDLWSFSLASRQCCAVAASQRFIQVRVTAAANGGDLVRALAECADMLDRDGGRYQHVRRLKIVPPDEATRVLHYGWHDHGYAPALEDMHRFCHPSMRWHGGLYAPMMQSDTDEPWLVLADFIGRFPALRDFVWGFLTIPPPVLAAVHAAAGCRLHMHGFWLGSVQVERGGVVDVHPDDFALATSPALYSVVAAVRSFEAGGEINFLEEALLGMVAGAAPNLRHVWLLYSQSGDSIPLRQAYAMGKPPAPPGHPLFFPEPGRRGSLRSLFFSTVPQTINSWAARTDFSKLRRLAFEWDTTCVGTLTAIAARGELASLRGLCLDGVSMDGASAGRGLLAALGPNSLCHLQLEGHINDALFDAILDEQGASLRHLSLYPYEDDRYDPGDDDTTPPPFVLTPALCARLAEACVNLEHALLPARRTLGDARECAVYRGLGRLGRLKRLLLKLQYTVHPADGGIIDLDAEFIDSHEIPRPLVAQGDRDWHFSTLLAWFARQWVCERRDSGAGASEVEAREVDPDRTVAAGREWRQFAEEGSRYDYEPEDVYGEAFGDVWPQAIGEPRWWEGWSSMPLRPDEND